METTTTHEAPAWMVLLIFLGVFALVAAVTIPAVGHELHHHDDVVAACEQKDWPHWTAVVTCEKPILPPPPLGGYGTPPSGWKN